MLGLNNANKKGCDILNYEDLALEFIQTMQRLGKIQAKKDVKTVMSGSMFIVLTLHAKGDHVSPGEISKNLNISTARVATSLNLLESKELIIRKNDKNDRRKIIVVLTDKGRRLAVKHHENVKKKITDLFESLGEDDTRDLVRISRKIADGMVKRFNEGDIKNDKDIETLETN